MHVYKSIVITFNLLGSMVTSHYRCGTIFHMLVHVQTIIWKVGTIESRDCKKITLKELIIQKNKVQQKSLSDSWKEVVLSEQEEESG